MNLYDFRAELEAAERAYRVRRRLFVISLGLMIGAALAAAYAVTQGVLP